MCVHLPGIALYDIIKHGIGAMSGFHEVFQEGEVCGTEDFHAEEIDRTHISPRLTLFRLQMLSPYRLCLCMILHEAHHCRTSRGFSPEASDQVMQFLQAKTNVNIFPLGSCYQTPGPCVQTYT